MGKKSAQLDRIAIVAFPRQFKVTFHQWPDAARIASAGPLPRFMCNQVQDFEAARVHTLASYEAIRCHILTSDVFKLFI